MDLSNKKSTATQYWFEDKEEALTRLSSLMLEFAAQAALVIKKNKLWICTEQINPRVAEELANAIGEYKIDHETLKIFSLAYTNNDYVLYFTPLSLGYSLALIFDPEISFSSIKARTKDLAKYLPCKPPHFIQGQFNDVSEKAATKEVRSGPHFSQNITGARAESGKHQPQTSQLGLFDIAVEDGISANNRVLPKNTTIDYEQQVETHKPGSTLPETEDLAVNQGLLEEVPSQDDFDFASPGLYSIPYACLLIPRMKQHYLVGDISDYLSDWLLDICQAYAWRVEIMAIRPEYLQWVVSAFPTTSPSNLIRIIRRQTSRKIFEEYPRLKRENPSGDFWAPGYLVMAGSHLHPVHMVNGYIRQTRLQQGLNP
ncbi:MAG: IS200/IS605 family transposase [Anaerolineales bacterium]|nr:IS200/IS605 family transposase [Anaerolineales bacterium]